MDPLNRHHAINHQLLRIATNNFQDKSGYSTNVIQSVLFEQGVVLDCDKNEWFKDHPTNIEDYMGYPIDLDIYESPNLS